MLISLRRVVVVLSLAAMALSDVAGSRAFALVVAPNAGNTNTTAPADDPGWLNVGDVGVYVGNRWVLTANHVGVGTINFPGVGVFSPVAGSAVQVPNPTGLGLSTFTDLVMYRLTTDPGLPALSIAAATPPVNGQITLIGDGLTTFSNTETQWNVTGTSPSLAWAQVPSGGNAFGYVSDTSGKRWGTNLVERDSDFFTGEGDANHTVVVNLGGTHVISLFTEFDKTGETVGGVTTAEAQAQVNDSGGGVFYKNGVNWELAGIIDAVGPFANQPGGGSNTAVFGNLTFSVDLSAYRNQILTIRAIPEVGAGALVGAVAALVAIGKALVTRRSHRRASASLAI